MKAILRIPGKEMYSYVEFEIEKNPASELSSEEFMRRALEDFDALMREYKGGEGLSEKEFNHFIDRMLLGEDNHVEEYQRMSEKQKEAVQVLKRALKRLKYNHGASND